MPFLVHGSIAYDLLLHHDGNFRSAIFSDSDELSVSYIAEQFTRHHGGTAANIAWNLRLLGQQVRVVGAVGFDGDGYLALLAERGIETGYIERISDAITATAVVATDSSEHQIAFFHPGADSKGSIPSLMDEREDISLAIISPRDALLMLRAAKQCKQDRIPYLFDPGQQSHAFGRDEFRFAIAGSRGLVVNAYEWALSREKLEWDSDDILKVCPLIVITQGEEGLTLHTREDTVVIPACRPEKVINPTGAGDALRAGLLVGIVNGWTLGQAGRLGAAMGSFAVEQEGTLIDQLNIVDVGERVLLNYGEELPHLA